MRADRVFDTATAWLFAVGAAAMAAGAVRGLAYPACAAAMALAALAALLLLSRYARRDWRPRRSRPFTAQFALLALGVVPASLASVDPLRSIPIGAAMLLAYLAFFAFEEAFTAGPDGICSPRFLVDTLAAGSAAAFALRLACRARGGYAAAMPWLSLAPPDTGEADRFDHLFAFFLAAALPVLLEAGAAARGRRRALLLACAAAGGAGVVLSFARAAWLAVAVDVGLLAALSRPARRTALAFGLAAALAAALVPGVLARAATVFDPGQRTNLERLDQWAVALEMIARAPLLGFGPGTFGEVYRQISGDAASAYPGPHSIVLHFAAEFGLPGLFFFLASVYHVFARLRPRDGQAAAAGGPGLRAGAAAAFAGVLVLALFHF